MPPQTKTSLRSRRTRVPRKLHSELSNYASLLRSMRINDTGDLVGELIRHGKRKRDEVNKKDGGDNESKRTSRKRPHTQPSPEPERETVQPSPQEKRRKPQRKDMYTLWPLFPEHCPTPDFSFEEEITAVAEEWMRNRSPSNQGEGESVNEPKENSAAIQCKDDLPIQCFDLSLSTSQMTSLILSSVAFLRTLLRTLAFHRVGSAAAPQSRGKPMNWVDVLEIFAGGGALGLGLNDSKVIERIQARLGDIYEDHAPQIAIAISKSKQTLREMDRKFQNTIFEKLSIPTLSREWFNSRTDQESAGAEEEVDSNEDGSGSEEWEEENEQENNADGMNGKGTGNIDEDEDKHLRSRTSKSTSSSILTPTTLALHNNFYSDSECDSGQENTNTTTKLPNRDEPSPSERIPDSSSSASKELNWGFGNGPTPVSADSSVSGSTSESDNTEHSKHTKQNNSVLSRAVTLVSSTTTSLKPSSDDDRSDGEEPSSSS